MVAAGVARVASESAEELDALARRFPAGFAWGAATASYQIEGSVDADGRGPSIWDTFSHLPGRVVGADTGDVACDHYRRWESDLDLMADLGLRAYRFSVAWPRVQPRGSGPCNSAGLDFYDRLVDGLLARGIEPWVTLYHWDLPQALEDRGGWTEPMTVERYTEYASIVARRLGDRVTRWITLNEPRTHALIGYGTGRHAPGRQGWSNALRAAHRQHLAHASARIAAAPLRPEWGTGSRVLEHGGEQAGNGWEIWADVLRTVLGRINGEYAPAEIAITENGATFPEVRAADGSVDDVERRWYLARHVQAAAEAVDDGVPLVGYFAWSLLDNFEWALGYGTRFGIVHVDYATQRRTVKASGRWYRDLIAATQPRYLPGADQFGH